MPKALPPKPVNQRIPLLVTTAHRGVFFGYGDPAESDKKSIRLEEARMCVYWSADLRGVIGLATSGPSAGCRIGPAAQALTLHDVTAVIEVSKESEEKWKQAPWG